MSISIASGLASAMTAQLAASLSGCFIDIYTGAAPASADLAPTGTLLGTVCVGSLPGAGLHFLTSGPTVSKANEPWGFQAAATGTAGWFRIRKSGDTGLTDTNATRIDGTIGTPDDPGDMTWVTVAVLTGLHYTIDAFVYSILPI